MLLAVSAIVYIIVLLANTGWLGMALVNLAFDTSRESRHESMWGTKAKIIASAVVELLLLTLVFGSSSFITNALR